MSHPLAVEMARPGKPLGPICPYHVAEYRDPETGRTRWAVLHIGTGAFYFASRYGYDAAERLRNRMSKEAA